MDGQAKISLLLELKNRIKSGLGEAKEQIAKATGDMKSRLSGLKDEHLKSFREMKESIPGFSGAMSMLSNPYALMTAGAIALGVAGVGLAKSSGEWEKGMAKVNVTAQLGQKDLKGLSDQLVAIGSKSATPLEQIPEAFNTIISAGFSVKQSLDALDPTLKASKAGFTDLKVTANAATAIMGASGENINKVYDVMFATLNKGKLEFQDLANYMPQAVSAAQILGFKLGEVGGAFATLSTAFRPEQAATMLRNVYQAFSNVKTRKNMLEMGVKVFDSKGQARPFVDIISDMKAKLKGLTPEQASIKIGKLGLDQEAGNALNYLTKNMDALKTNTDFAVNSAGQLDKAYGFAKTGTDDWVIALNQLKAAVKPIGDFLWGMFSKAGTVFKGLVEWTLKYWDVLKWPLAALMVYPTYMIAIRTATMAWTAAQWLLNVAMNANPIGLIVTGIALLISYVVIAIQKWDDFGAAMTVFLGPIGAIISLVMEFKKHWDEITYAFEHGGIIAGIKKIGAVIIDALIYPIQQLLAKIGEFTGLKFAKNWADDIKKMRTNVLGIEISKDQTKEVRGAKQSNPFSPTDKKTEGKKDPTAPPANPADGITKDAQKGHNFTVNIKSFVENMNISNKNIQEMSDSQIAEFFRTQFLRITAEVQDIHN